MTEYTIPEELKGIVTIREGKPIDPNSHHELGDIIDNIMDGVDRRFFYLHDSYGHKYIVVDVTTPNMKN